MLKYFLVLNLLLRLANFYANLAIKKSLIKLLIKFKNNKSKNDKNLFGESSLEKLWLHLIEGKGRN